MNPVYVVIYVSRDGIEVERATGSVDEALLWIAENPLHENLDGAYEIWETEPGDGPTKVRDIWARESRDLHARLMGPKEGT